MTDAPSPRCSSGTNLLPCPFCGEDQPSLNSPSKWHRYGSINCPACLVNLPGATSDQAELIECWNGRADLGGAAQGSQEPVAWQARDLKGGIWRHCDYPHSNPEFEYRPLYASPVPSTDRGGRDA